MKHKYTPKMVRLGLPIVHMPKRKPQRHIDWIMVWLIAGVIAWWVLLIWAIIQYKGGTP